MSENMEKSEKGLSKLQLVLIVLSVVFTLTGCGLYVIGAVMVENEMEELALYTEDIN